MKPQQKITIEMCAARILELMIHYDLVHNRMVLYQMLRIDKDTIDAAIRWLRRKAFIWHRDPTFVTDEGREYYEGACRRSEVGNAADAHKWKVEALTGIVETRSRQSGHTVTRQSDIEDAALPTNKPDCSTSQTPEEILDDLQEEIAFKKRAAKKLGVSVDELERHMENDRLHICPSMYGAAHIGIFDDRKSKYCRKCRK